MAQGNSVVHLYPAQLRKIVIPVPHPDEQRKIADTLSALDAKISAVADQIAHMQTFKQGLLQQMFV
jgi:type I restriction enzyme S subunit